MIPAYCLHFVLQQRIVDCSFCLRTGMPMRVCNLPEGKVCCIAVDTQYVYAAVVIVKDNSSGRNEKMISEVGTP